MNCIFKILWFEDEPTWYRMQTIRITQLMNKHCLKANITRKTGDDFALSDLCGNEYDLILMDYKLASGNTGDAIISSIRSQNILTDILFYSSQYDEMLTAIQNISPPIDGVYYSDRKLELFQLKIEKLVDKIVKRSEDLINLRGFVLDNSCDFEVRVREVLNIAWQKFTEPEQAVLEEAVQKTIKFNETRQLDNQNKVISQHPVFPPAVNNEHFFSHSDRLYLLTKVLKILKENYGFQPKPEYENFKGNYEENISQYRNALGHRKSGENTIEIRKQMISIDEELHQKMRANINSYDALIEEIEVFITQNI